MLSSRIKTDCPPCVGVVSMIYNPRATGGDGPYYDDSKDELIWVDSKEQSLNFLGEKTWGNRRISLLVGVGAAIPCEGEEDLLVATTTGKDICLIEKPSGFLRHLQHVDQPDSLTGGKCDRLGRLWFGTKPKSASKTASLFSYNGVLLEQHKISDVKVAQSIAWSPDYTRMYLTDPGSRKVFSFDYDESAGRVKKQRVLVDFSKQKLGLPYGLAVDVEGKLWIAGCYDGRIYCWDQFTGEMIAYVEIPARCVSSCCFGGPDYDRLFVTSFALGSDAENKIKRYHRPGAVFVVQDLSTCGQPANKFIKHSL